MIDPYNHKEIEPKWQAVWEEEKAFAASDDFSKPKYYPLVEFPYPSGQGLHVGHPRPYTALDIVARKRRMQGYNVLYPMGWDAFGLPTENYAIQNHIHPATVTRDNVARFRKQLQSLGYSFDWDREVDTTDPEYYKWTQWIFLKLYEAGLAYKGEMPINWCTSCKVGLANEEVVHGVCERCGGEVTRKVKSQWMLKITEYADRLIDDLDEVDYIERVRVSQINWIGRSHGAEVDFPLLGGAEQAEPCAVSDNTPAKAEERLRVYTTRPDTLFGATYMVVSPEHPAIEKHRADIRNWEEVAAYREMASKKSDFERTELVKEKTGVMLDGLTALNPLTQKEIPVWISDYVLITYGTGAIMAVPAHDERDWEFAKKFHMPIVEVVAGSPVSVQEAAYTDVESGTLVNSGFLNGLSVPDAIEKVTLYIEENGLGSRKTNFKLRDWVFSRQRYWGEPIPIVECEKCGYIPLEEKDLPLELPKVDSYLPTDTGESPLAVIEEWVNTTCPCCKGPAKRETDTMPQWAGSSWYFLRYIDPGNKHALASKEALEYWMPVDWYNGGMEHTTLHMLYSRFWHKFLYDQKVVHCKEPYSKRTSHGMILGADGQKMSKSRGNVVNPDDIVRDYGADTLRTYEMFIGAFELSAAWSEEGVRGCRRFLERVWKLRDILADGDDYSPDMEIRMHQTMKKVSNDYESLKYNTAIAAMMSLINDFYKKSCVTRGEFKTFLTLLNPVAPHITEELWQAAGYEGRVYQAQWPQYEEAKTIEDTVEIALQVNGKVRAVMNIARDEGKEVVLARAKEELGSKLSGSILKEVYVPGRIVNFVVK